MWVLLYVFLTRKIYKVYEGTLQAFKKFEQRPHLNSSQKKNIKINHKYNLQLKGNTARRSLKLICKTPALMLKKKSLYL